MGKGAGFYLDATQAPWAANFQMYTYITEELAGLRQPSISASDMQPPGRFSATRWAATARMTIGAPERRTGFKAVCSALGADRRADDQPTWGRMALPITSISARTRIAWRRSTTPVALVKDGARFPEFLDRPGQGRRLPEPTGLRPVAVSRRPASKTPASALTLRRHARTLRPFSYYFISTFMDDHLRWHAERL